MKSISKYGGLEADYVVGMIMVVMIGGDCVGVRSRDV